MHQALYKRSSRANAPENQNADWQEGYADGQRADREPDPLENESSHRIWLVHWGLVKLGLRTDEQWAEWKKGWCARLQCAMFAGMHKED